MYGIEDFKKDLLFLMKPEMIFFENVPGILTAGDEVSTTYIDWFKRQMRNIVRPEDDDEEGGYGIKMRVVNAANYGVPQKRRRAIGLCVYGADDDDLVFPSSTHAQDPIEGELEEWVTVNDVIDREDLKQDLNLGQKQVGLEDYPDDPGHRSRQHQQQTVDLIQAIRKHGRSWRDLKGTDDEDLIRDCHQSLDGTGADTAYGIMSGDKPAPTLTTRCATVSCGRFTHPEEDRSITFREAALLMSFPRDFELPDANNHAERIVGNAVPPKLVESLVRRFYDENL